ncbi:hypothetical protein DFH09DRAFT_1287558 [Mycena vulgaris]|nr:hypothetical protein DFH09DRAFT_1287558 [Mycena vulgaris]
MYAMTWVTGRRVNHAFHTTKKTYTKLRQKGTTIVPVKQRTNDGTRKRRARSDDGREKKSDSENQRDTSLRWRDQSAKAMPTSATIAAAAAGRVRVRAALLGAPMPEKDGAEPEAEAEAEPEEDGAVLRAGVSLTRVLEGGGSVLGSHGGDGGDGQREGVGGGVDTIGDCEGVVLRATKGMSGGVRVWGGGEASARAGRDAAPRNCRLPDWMRSRRERGLLRRQAPG